jgi:hypothetical protein
MIVYVCTYVWDAPLVNAVVAFFSIVAVQRQLQERLPNLYNLHNHRGQRSHKPKVTYEHSQY